MKHAYPWKIGTLFSLLALAAGTIGGAEAERPIEAKLNELKAESESSVPPEVLEAGQKGVDELARSGIVERALHAGDPMPVFTLNDAHGNPVSSADLLADGPIVVVFYRGAWCPYCNLYLASIREYLPAFAERGATLVAISGENPDNTLTVAQKNSLAFPVLSDADLAVSRQFGIVYEMPKVTNDVLLQLGFDIAKYYGSDRAELPLAATYVVAADGTIAWDFVDVDYKKRAEPADIVKALDGLQ